MSTKDMHVKEKQAWFVFVVTLTAFVLYGIAVSIIGFQIAAVAAFGFCGFAGFAGLIGGKEKNVLDERDTEIARLAALFSLYFFWVVFILGSVVPRFVLGDDVTIKLSTLNWIAFPCMCAVFLVQALTTIILYRRGGNA
jgi:hypothetical protein